MAYRDCNLKMFNLTLCTYGTPISKLSNYLCNLWIQISLKTLLDTQFNPWGVYSGLHYKNMMIVNDAISWSITLESSITLLESSVSRKLPYFIKYTAHLSMVSTWISQRFLTIFLFFKNNLIRINHCTFIHHKTLSQLPSMCSAQEIFQHHFQCIKVHTILDKIQYAPREHLKYRHHSWRLSFTIIIFL